MSSPCRDGFHFPVLEPIRVCLGVPRILGSGVLHPSSPVGASPCGLLPSWSPTLHTVCGLRPSSVSQAVCSDPVWRVWHSWSPTTDVDSLGTLCGPRSDPVVFIHTLARKGRPWVFGKVARCQQLAVLAVCFGGPGGSEQPCGL